MAWTPSPVFMCVLAISFLWAAAATKPKNGSKGGKEKWEEPARDEFQLPEPPAAVPDPVLKGNSRISMDSPYILLEDYEQSIQEMVIQLWNSSEPADRKCQVNLRLWRSNKRSLSPWAYRINHDATRIPADIPEAQCLCTGCINPFTIQEDRSIVSIPIYSKLPVRRLLCPTPQGARAKPRRKKKKRCHKEYKMVMETIAVGCTCIF